MIANVGGAVVVLVCLVVALAVAYYLPGRVEPGEEES